ncbi:serine/threonine-protein kinase [Nannocystis sp. SCPEA4]|uniref:serine/threonine-protein kinase n=1 Tax=Nannocystis sp. SCPEA4 TaxID=2996787 RepID=UPI00227156E3|nr:serine/threonine-protein kinase [Nannocystis sp. SCPEA4]MCY1059690.1 tetratricopeptide repeat protein [Nannocystis sp. SCPEA4]
MLDIPATDPPLPHPVDDEETDRITVKFAAQLTGDALDSSGDGLKIDRYINAEVRARGGMGRVFVAYDPGLDRTVALKALPVGLLPHEPGADTPRREGMALAHIDHPNVVRVLELVEHRGLACLVLEHVDGPHLGDWLKAPRDFRDILHKFIQAGEGLAAVHRAGLVHRDFKPANAVVGPGGVVKLIDFGLAVRPESRRLDDPDDRPGTPRYMAPEQIDGRQVDARSDQFSFCVALYEALFRAHPYLSRDDTPSAEQNANAFDADAEQASRATIFDQILVGVPRRPERVPPGLSPTVVAALLRGLSPASENRFDCMDPLLAELRRDPRRNRRKVFFGIAGVLAFTAGLYAALRPERCPPQDEYETQIWDEKMRAQVKANLSAFGDGPGKAVDEAVARLATAQREACEEDVRRPVQDTDDARDECLRLRKSELVTLLRQIERSDQNHISELLKNLKDLPPVSSCDDLIRLRFNCHESGLSAQARIDSTTALLVGDTDRALARANDALREAEISGTMGSRARAHILLGRIAYARGDRPRAMHQLTQAIDLAEHNVCLPATAEAYHWFVKLAAFDEQIPLPRAESYSQYHGYRISDTDRAAQANVLNNRALLAERRIGDLPRAERLLREAIKLRQPENDQTAEQANSYLNLSSVLYKLGRYDEALNALDKADTRRSNAVGPEHPDHAKHLRNRGLIEMERGKKDRALDYLQEALTQAAKGLGTDAPYLGEYYDTLVKVHDRMGDFKSAAKAAEGAVAVYKDANERSAALENLAQALMGDKKFDEAISKLDEAERVLGADKRGAERRGLLESKRAEALVGLQRHREAERRARQALYHFDDAGLVPDDLNRADANLFLGEALNSLRRWREATVPFERAVAIWRARAPESYLLPFAWTGLAESLSRLPKRAEDARRAADEARNSLSVIDDADDRHSLEKRLAACRPH